MSGNGQAAALRGVGGWRRAVPPQFLMIVPATLLLYAISLVVAPGSVAPSSLLTVLCFASILALAALGQTLVIQQGGLDLSVPGVISLAAVLVTKFPAGDNAVLALWIAAALASGLLSGLLCGVAITRFRVTPLVATLAVNALLYGTVLYLTKGTSTEAVPSGLGTFAVGRTIGVPNLAWFALVVVTLAEVVVRATVMGRRFVAVGVSARAARAAALPVTSTKIITYGVAGVAYALAGVLLAGYLGVPSLLVGQTYLLPTITVVVLGGTSLTGGAGSVAATAIGAIFLVQLQQVIIGMGAPTSAQFIIQAAIILLGMALRAVPWRIGAGGLRARVAGQRALRPGG
ncbi:ABC transporter permease [Lichenifustis flavocetrariae]|uniref:Autoinducer 2 import system permease protein LsrC n=1 Tax=Lichenifustis flavocetrariae TaxID=2949735 RepID=A0AA41Z632_9HYPH|nr:ABC transporter permease [Lichenifustis flavocetrariae]MCW6511183.1 ABC transporter permease [Lichenifustis flavocetrariae]